ncbi:MAG: glycosyltransferase [Candidatus Nanoarchaeia archaeon]
MLKYKIGDPIIKNKYILYVGDRAKHKNISHLIKAFNLIKDKIPHYLVIAGKKIKPKDEVDELISKLNLKNRVIEITPSDLELANLYKYADLFVFPSLFEGFGLPPIEAVIFGVSVILSDIPSQRENFGDSATYFNPLDEKDIAKKILLVLNDKQIKENLLEKEKKRIKEVINKEKIIGDLVNVLYEVANS